MSDKIKIYGAEINLPPVPDELENWGTNIAGEQYWRRKELPKFFESVEYDKEGNALLDLEQSYFAGREVDRCKKGFWFYNNGVPTFLTGKHYFYLQWWKLEDDIYGDFRDADRRYFLFLVILLHH